jgi:hypothetical protein
LSAAAFFGLSSIARSICSIALSRSFASSYVAPSVKR